MVPCDSVGPRSKVAALHVVRIGSRPDPHEHVLHKVLDETAVAESVQSEAEQLVRVSFIAGHERSLIARLADGSHHVLVGAVHLP